MYPCQRNIMGNPYISPIYPYIVGVYGLLSPRIPIFSPYKYHGYTYVRGTPNCPLISGSLSNLQRYWSNPKISMISPMQVRHKKRWADMSLDERWADIVRGLT